MLIIFDLDGTLIDSSQDLAISANATRKQFGLPPLDGATINSYVGNGAAVLVRKAMGTEVSEADQVEALAFFLSYYRAHSLEHTQLYEGIGDALKSLAGEHQLAVLTNKPQKISFDILAGLGLGRTFTRVIGGDTLPVKKPDPAGILELMREGAAAQEETWMVGDSGVDILAARRAGVRSCGVLWGFQPGTFAAEPPDVTVSRPEELVAVVGKAATKDF